MRIKEVLKRKKMTSKTLSKKTGLTEMGISNILTGKSSPNADTIMKIASALGVKCGELFDDFESEKKTLPADTRLLLDGEEYEIILNRK